MADSSTSSTSSTSQNASKPRKRSHFRAKIKVQNIQIVVRNLHQNNIKLSVKNLKRKRSKYTQHKMAARNQTKDLNCDGCILSIQLDVSCPFIRGYVFSRLITYAGGKPLQKGEREKEIKSPYVKISGQKTSYDCAVYVMKWMEIIEPENIKKGKYQWDNWPQEEVDHYRVEYASRILFSEMNTQRDQAIRESSAIRLSKPSSILLSPFCQINSADIETG
ncbi:hypothetical protein Ahy_B05g079455 [Arachis hypogaea]|uniref:Ubiquitin-like protease family profile domain-containing protein n=1 Tax=Arachis hypogaea TaxID=3818 RepID=A0A444Z9V6_ARAHY|nr:hypothetical protein Ahy_B05g079455 [Arachis hypogaea]